MLLKNKYFKNTGWLLAEKGFRFALLLYLASVVARYLGPERLGIYNFAQSYVILFLVCSTLGLDTIVVQDLLKKKEQTNEIMGTAFLLKLVSSTLTIGVLYFSAKLLKFDPLAIQGIVIFGSTYLFHSFNVIDFFFQSHVASRYIVISNLVGLVISSGLKLYGIHTEKELTFFYWTYLLDVVIYILFFNIFYRTQGNSIFNWRFSMDQAKSLLKQSFPLILSGAAVTLYIKIDQVMIKQLLGYNEVGIYSAASKLTEVWHVLPMVLVGSFFPSIVNTYEEGNGSYKDRLRLLYGGLLLFAIALALGTTIAADLVVDILYGDQYTRTANVLRVHIWSSLFVFLGVANSKWFIIKGLQKLTFYFTLTSAILNVGLNYLLIPTLGIEGAAWATLVSSSFSSYFCMFFMAKSCRENIVLSSRSFNVIGTIKMILNIKKYL